MTPDPDRNDLERFLLRDDAETPFPVAAFKGQRIPFFRDALRSIAELAAEPARDEALCDRIITTLAAANRFYDIAALYAAAKKRYGPPRDLDAAFRRALLAHIHDLFTATLTYHSPELDTLFCETLGDDRPRFLELLGGLFEKRRLYTLRLSPAIQSFFYTIVDENIRTFVQHANIHFLAFYLTTLRDLPQRTGEHLDKWVSLLLSPSTNRDLTEKILGAMRIHPVAELLILLILLPRDQQRSTVLTLLRSLLERRPYLLREQRTELAAVLMRAFDSHFYDYHRIPQEQKVAMVNLALFADDPALFERLCALIAEDNPSRDPKRTDTKKVCAAALARQGEKEPRHIAALRGLLRDETIEESVRQDILSLLRDRADRDRTLVSPYRTAPLSESDDDDEKTLVDRRPA